MGLRSTACRAFQLSVLLAVAVPGCAAPGQGDEDVEPCAPEEGVDPFEPIFKTGFEPGEAEGQPADAHTQITFQNLGNPAAGSLPLPSPVVMPIYYEGGTATDRYARIIEDPTDPGNRVLHHWMKNATIPVSFDNHTKGRIQSAVNFGEGNNVTTLYSRQRIYLHPDIGEITGYPATNDPWWISMTIQELWLGAEWEGHPNPARISLLVAPDAAGELRLGASADSMLTGEQFWVADNPGFVVPTGEWLTLEVAYRMGNASTGRFVVRIQRADCSASLTVLDVTNWTYNPHADEAGGTGPVPLTQWNPQKLYSSDNVLHFIRDSGGVAQLYWDDFEFSDSWPASFIP